MTTRKPASLAAERRKFLRSTRNDAKFTKKLEAHWRKILADDGFQDLEGIDRDGPLGNRGNLHESGEEDAVPLVDKIEHGAAYIDWARDVLQRLNGHTTEARRKRAIWERHADGETLKHIGRTMPGVNFYEARKTVMEIEEKYKCPQDAREREPRDELAIRRRTLKPLPTEILASIAAAMIRAARN